MIVWLRIVAPKAKQGSFKVRLPLLVGRGDEAKFRIQHHQVSRRHCELFAGDGAGVFLRDLGSTNGTFLDGEQIPTSTRTAVRSGGLVRVGKVAFVVEYQQPGVPHVRSDGDDATQPGIAIAAVTGGDDESFAMQTREEPAAAADGWEAIGGFVPDQPPGALEPVMAGESAGEAPAEPLSELGPDDAEKSRDEARGDEPAADDATPGDPEKPADAKLFDFLKGLE